jgi:two-component system chemotaxis sensor kinase CheA
MSFNDLEQFKQTFIQEATELLEDMEERLVAIDDEGEIDLEEINAIFRCAHSIKGGAGSFGFDRLVKFTHVLEFLLDNLRTEEMEITPEIIDALLKSVDVVSALVNAAKNNTEAEAGYEDEMLASLKAVSEKKVAAKSQKHEVVEEAYGIFDEPSLESSENQSGITNNYQIIFKPYKDLFNNGNEPLFIIRELQKVSKNLEVKVDISKVPSLEDLEPIDCYFSWDIKVFEAESLDKVSEAFEFVDGECFLEINLIDDIGEHEKAGIFENSKPQEEEAYGLFEEVPPVKTEVVNNVSTISQNKNSAKVAEVQKQPDNKDKDAVTSIRVDINKVDKMVNMVGELVITQAMILQRLKDIPEQYLQKLMQGVAELSRHTRDLQEAVMSVRMQPRKLNKQVRLEMKGEATEIDKTVIEQLSDPLVHMIRNSLDHGIEKPEDRIAKGKPEEGVIRLSADSSGGRILIEISDDGAGINREKVFKKAVEKGLFQPDALLKPEEIDNIIFMAGFSTAESVTDVSGRGVGMDVVRKNIKDLGGEINMFNNPGYGMSFIISLPLTLAILDGMIIKTGSEKYILPINNILETMQVKRSEISMVKKGSEVVNVRGSFIPIIYLSEVFKIKSSEKNSESILIVLVESGRNRLGIVVDDLLGQQQVVIKNLEENSDKVEGISGATILGDGNVSLILDVAQIYKMGIEKQNEQLKEVA